MTAISVKYVLMLILIVIIILGLIGIVNWVLNEFRTDACVKEQVRAVNDIEGLVDEVYTTGQPAVEKIKINGVCVECMWYNASTRQMEIKFKDAVSPVPINVSRQWGNVLTGPGCGETESNMQAGQTHFIEVKPNEIVCTTCI